jgi:hypothetical protein
MRAEGAGAVVVLGGDGTNRAVATGWPDAPVVPLSTGTNNVFPAHVEPTVGGAAAGLVASGAVSIAGVARRAKAVRVEIDGERPDFALVDAVLTAERFVGLRTPFEPATLRAAVLAIADPAAVGISPVAGLVHPCLPGDDGGVELRFGIADRAACTVDAPISPGLYATVGLERVAGLPLGEVVEAEGPGVLAFDGDRRRMVVSGARVRFRVERDGPNVIDVPATMAAAAGAGLYVR